MWANCLICDRVNTRGLSGFNKIQAIFGRSALLPISLQNPSPIIDSHAQHNCSITLGKAYIMCFQWSNLKLVLSLFVCLFYPFLFNFLTQLFMSHPHKLVIVVQGLYIFITFIEREGENVGDYCRDSDCHFKPY